MNPHMVGGDSAQATATAARVATTDCARFRWIHGARYAKHGKIFDCEGASRNERTRLCAQTPAAAVECRRCCCATPGFGSSPRGSATDMGASHRLYGDRIVHYAIALPTGSRNQMESNRNSYALCQSLCKPRHVKRGAWGAPSSTTCRSSQGISEWVYVQSDLPMALPFSAASVLTPLNAPEIHTLLHQLPQWTQFA